MRGRERERKRAAHMEKEIEIKREKRIQTGRQADGQLAVH